MSVLISCEKISKIQASKTIFSGLNFSFHDTDHIGIVGPNGAGKSTLLKILAGIEEIDDGIISRKQNLRTHYVAQNESFDGSLSIDDVAHRYLESRKLDFSLSYSPLLSMLDRAGFQDLEQKTGALSGGWRKRLALALAFGVESDALLLDEPTNHLDLEGILWLEKMILSEKRAIIFVSHDRYLLDAAAKSIVEINSVFPNGTFSVEGDYSTFISRKADFLETQKSELASLANKLRREEEWLRKGPKARTTKSQSRIDAALALREQVSMTASRRESDGASIQFESGGRKSKKYIEAKSLGVSFDDRTIFSGINLVLGPQDRLGVMGPNGSGKSTLVKALLGKLKPTSGTVQIADGLRVVYFDQQREQIADHATIKTVLAPDSDSVSFRGRSLHIISYIRPFSFQADQLHTPVAKLSGGERARLLIAKLMLQPADLLILDEPTNDLDINTLENLEENLASFEGGMILITHDRYLMDRISTRILALDGNSNHEFFADYSQWKSSQDQKGSSKKKKSENEKQGLKESNAEKKSKLSFSEKHELAEIGDKIAKAEAELAKFTASLESPEVASNSMKLQELATLTEKAQHKVDSLYQRWQELEQKNN